jgi:hypothetical protein
VIRLDRNTELKIETILARSLSTKRLLTNLLLFKGQIYVMYKNYVHKEIFQVITPYAAMKLNHNSVALIDSSAEGGSDIVMSEGKGYALYGPDENSVKKETVKKSEKVTVTPDHQVVVEDDKEIKDFVAWNEKMNREFSEFHEGKAMLPLPIQKLSKAVMYFAQKYSYLFGEWIYDKYLGYVWRPFLNDRLHGGGWTPYHNGRWTSVQGQLFWVPSEPWGWVPYHLGIWMWNKTKGWLWIPGSVFAPAWVDWGFHNSFFCWRAWSITDWYLYGVVNDGYFPYLAHLIHPDDDPYYIPGDQEDTSGLPVPASGKATAKQVIAKDQLKKKEPPFPMPKELKETYKRVVIAMKNGEEEILAPMRETPNHMLIVGLKDLNAAAIQEKAVKLTSLAQKDYRDLLDRRTQQDSYLQAAETYKRNEKMAVLQDKVTSLIRDLEGLNSLGMQEFQMSEVIVDNKKENIRDENRKEVTLQSSGIPEVTPLQGRTAPSPDGVFRAVDRNRGQSGKLNPGNFRAPRSSVRFLDWNPDVNIARKVGISIRYSSRSNEVRCPELNMSSRQVSGSRGYEGPRVQLTMRGAATATVSGGSVGAGSAAGNVSSTATSTAKKGDSNASSSGKGGVVKK